MEMKKEDIAKMYREAADPANQIGILADLNCTTKGEIVKVLVEAGIPEAEIPYKSRRGRPPKKKGAAEAEGIPEEVLDACMNEMVRLQELADGRNEEMKRMKEQTKAMQEEIRDIEQRIVTLRDYCGA